MVHTVVYLKVGGILSPGPGYYGKPPPVRSENPERPGDHSVCRNNFKTPVPVQGIIRLLEFQKYLLEDHLPHGRNILW